MSASWRTRWGAAILVAAPIVVLVAFLGHPSIGNPGDPGFFEAIAAEVAENPGLWIFSHLLLAVGSGLLALAFIAAREHLRRAGEDRWSAVGLPLLVLGCVLFALLPAMEMAPVAAHEAGLGLQDVAAVQEALDGTVFPAVLLSGSAVFALGAIPFAVGVAKSGVMGPGTGKVAAGALVVAALCRFVPNFFVLFYIQSAALIVALWPLAYTLWRRPGEHARSGSVGAATT